MDVEKIEYRIIDNKLYVDMKHLASAMKQGSEEYGRSLAPAIGEVAAKGRQEGFFSAGHFIESLADDALTNAPQQDSVETVAETTTVTTTTEVTEQPKD